MTGTGKLVKTMVVEAADLAKYVASAAQVRSHNASCDSICVSSWHILNALSLWLGQVGLEWVDSMAAGDTTRPRSTPQARRTASASSAGSPSQRAGDAPLVSAIREAGAQSDSLLAPPFSVFEEHSVDDNG